MVLRSNTPGNGCTEGYIFQDFGTVPPPVEKVNNLNRKPTFTGSRDTTIVKGVLSLYELLTSVWEHVDCWEEPKLPVSGVSTFLGRVDTESRIYYSIIETHGKLRWSGMEERSQVIWGRQRVRVGLWGMSQGFIERPSVVGRLSRKIKESFQHCPCIRQHC